MASIKQLEANRNNARRSTGPKTDLGRARSRLNSCKHGLTARTVVIDGEDPADFERLLQFLEEDFEPASSIEVELVTRIAGYHWRLRRIPVFEAALLETRRTEVTDISAKRISSDHGRAIAGEKICIDQRNMGRALIRDSRDNDTLGKLSRYEAALLNAVDRTVRQLVLIQNARMAREESRQSTPIVISEK